MSTEQLYIVSQTIDILSRLLSSVRLLHDSMEACIYFEGLCHLTLTHCVRSCLVVSCTVLCEAGRVCQQLVA